LSIFGSLFRKRYAPLMGLDISSSSVKLVELDLDQQGRYTLVRAAIEPLEKGAIADGTVEKPDDVAEAVRRLIKRSGTRTRDVALALPSSAVISKKIILPGDLREEEIEVQVESEANQYIPFAIEDVALDFCVLGPSLGSPGDQEVLIAASRRDKVLERQAIAEAAGLKPRILDIDAFASRLAAGRLIERLPRGGHDLLVAMFEIGASSTSMQVLPTARPCTTVIRPSAARSSPRPSRDTTVSRRKRPRRKSATPICPTTTPARCWSPSSPAWRRKSCARCSSSSAPRPTARWTTSCWPAAPRRWPGWSSASPN
jgi:type IV pilus assembly protein PilM